MTTEERLMWLEESVRRIQEGSIESNTLTIGRGDGGTVTVRSRDGGSLIWSTGSGSSSVTVDGAGLSGGLVSEEPGGTVDGSNRTFTLSQTPTVIAMIIVNEAVYEYNHPSLTWTDNQFVIAAPAYTPDADDFFRAIFWKE